MSRDLHELRAPGERDARERAWPVVARAFAERAPARRTRSARPLAALAAAAAVAAAVATTPGRAVLGSIRDAVGRERVEHAKPALFSLPGGGRLLVNSQRGPWIVHADGSRRLLGRYAAASWSPHGLFLVATRAHQVTALEPTGRVHWTVARPGSTTLARWAPGDGYRVAYLNGTTLRVVAGNGAGDRPLARGVAGVAPAWRPDVPRHVLAYRAGRAIRVVDVDSGRTLWRARAQQPPLVLQWSTDGRRLAALSRRTLTVFDGRGRTLGSTAIPGWADASFEPHGHRLALALQRTRAEVAVLDADRLHRPPRVVFTGAGRFDAVAWSPDGRWLLISWPTADQWLFVRSAGVRRIVAVSNIAEQFGSSPAAGLPPLGGWCCAEG